MDSDIKALQEEVKRVGALSADTNRMVHKMRRSQRWGSIMSVLWWVLIFGASGLSYYYFIQPYVLRAEQAYGNAKSLQVEVQNFFAQFGHKTN